MLGSLRRVLRLLPYLLDHADASAAGLPKLRMDMPDHAPCAPIVAGKFQNKRTTAKGERRAWVDLTVLRTLWFNTGTLCNLACANCYIESTPKNDALVYLAHDETLRYLDEIAVRRLGTQEIGLTGGEPFMNPDIIPIMQSCLERGFRLLVLTNAMRPMMKRKAELLALRERFGDAMRLRVSVDHFKRSLHEEERGPRSWQPMMVGLKWLCEHGFAVDVAGRTRWGDEEPALRDGFAALFADHGITVDAYDPHHLILFPEMDPQAVVPEITTACWDLLKVSPDAMMCASSRMVVKRKGDALPSVMACTLLAYDQGFNMGTTLEEASQSVYLNHPHCAKFCVLGGGACSTTG
jgi:uncharacterized Fe-S cluster-containing radical SAM superfamily protein